MKPFDGAWDRVKVDQKIWTNTGTAGPLGVNPVHAKSSGQTKERDRSADASDVRRSKAWERRRRSERQRLASLGRDRELIADGDAHHRVTEQTIVQRGKQQRARD